MAKYQVRLDSVPAERKRLIRALRVVGGMRLAKAVEVCGFASTASKVVLVTGVDRAVAEHICRQLADAGASARVEDATIGSPMVLDPTANGVFEWGRFQTLRRVRHAETGR